MKTVHLASRVISRILVLTSIFLASALALFPAVISADPAEDKANVSIWNQSYDGGGDDYALDVVTDTADNVIVGGVYWNSSANGWYYGIVKYDNSSKYIWERSWNSGRNTGNPLLNLFAARSISLATDSRNNIVVCSMQRIDNENGTQDNRYIVKFSPQGELLWDKVYDNGGGQNIEGHSIAIDSDDNIISTGTSYTGADVFADTIKYAPDGTELWHNQAYDPPNGTVGNAVAVDSRNNVIVCGQVQNNEWIIKYDPKGNELWKGNDPSFFGAAVATDSLDNIVFTGLGQAGATLDYYTTKYDASGNLQWAVTYDSGFIDWGALDIAIDSQDNATVIGLSYMLELREGPMTRDEVIDFLKTADYCAVTHDPLGNTVCKRTYDGLYADWGFGVAVDSKGNVILTGTSYDGATFNYATVKYPRYTPEEEEPLPPAPERAAEESLVGSVPLPNQVSTDPKVIGTNVLLASFMVIAFYIAATLFNNTFKENYETIRNWGQRLRSRFRLSKPNTEEPMKVKRKRLGYLEVALIVVATALINSIVDPGFGLSSYGLIVFIAMMVASVASTYGYDGIQALTTRRAFRIPATVKVYPLAIPLAIAFVFLSRIVHFSPGLIFGFVGAYTVLSSTTNPNKHQRSVGIILGVIVITFIASLAFFIRQTLSTAGEGFWHSLADTILVATFVVCLEGLMFGLLPLTFLDGGTLASWKKWVWVIVFAIVSFVFYHVIVNKTKMLTDAITDMNVIVMLIITVCFVVFSVVFWLYFRLRSTRVRN